MDDNRNKVMEQFDVIANDYDIQRRKLIPCYDDFYQIPVSLASTTMESPKILDIGAGTGLFTSFMLAKYPKARATLIDISEKMLEVAKSRFKGNSNIKYIVDDYTKHKFEDTFDLVISSLSIHHLTDRDKKDLYNKIFSLMKDDSLFINADQVLGSTPNLETLYKDDWRKKIENSGLSKTDLMSAYERTRLDKMSTLDRQIDWLRDIGFSDVDCVYKYFNFVVLMGRKG
jgi:tRNA (cmo5U34)-methyltransferase